MCNGSMTGVRLMDTSHIKRPSIVVKDMTWVGQAQEVSEDEYDSEELKHEECRDGNGTSDETDEHNSSPADQFYRKRGRLYTCDKCDESFRTQAAVRKHASKCGIPVCNTTFLDRAGAIIHGNVNITEVCIRRVVIKTLGLYEEDLPTDIPSEEQLIKRANTM